MSKRFASAHPCPTATKKGYASLEDARADYLFQMTRGEPVAPFAYPCDCGRWHRTSRAAYTGHKSVWLGTPGGLTHP